MARYGNSVYQAAHYGANVSQVAGSVEPIYAVATGYSSVKVTWVDPLGAGTDFIAFKLLRNQDAYPETEEDGVVVWSWVSDDPPPPRDTKVTDGIDYTDVPISSGRYAYYRMWAQKSDESWAQAGEAYTVIPLEHGTPLPNGGSQTTLDKVVDLLPRVFTSISGAPIDEIDTSSAIYLFLSAFSFTLDEILTLAQLLTPDVSGRSTNPGTLLAQANQLGLPMGSSSVTKAQKRTVREALYTYSRKGTQNALSTWSESVTGFAPTITVSPNLFLTNQDSTFNGGLGSWVPVGNCALSVENSVYPSTAEALAIDMNYTGKVVVGASGAKIVNGTFAPTTLGIPVTAGTAYTFSVYAQANGSSKSIQPTIYWYDFQGNPVGLPTSASSTVGTSWAKKSVTATAPSGARFMSVEVFFGSAATYWVDMMQVSVSTATAFDEARGVTLYLAPTNSEANPYPNKQVKVVRMIEELYNVLPNNTPYRLLLDDTDPVVGFTH